MTDYKILAEERKKLIDELWAEKGELLKEIGRLEQTLWNWRNYGSE
jgi:hypothetical protein